MAFIGFMTIILLLILGGMAARAIVLSKVPQVQAVLDGVTPHQRNIGIAGIVVALISILYWIFRGLPYIGYDFIGILMWLVASLALLGLGLLFASDWVNGFLSSKPDIQGKINDVVGKLRAKQEVLGLIGIGLGLFYLLTLLLF